MSKLTPPSPTRRRPPRRRPLQSGILHSGILRFGFLRGVAQTLSIVVAFVGAGVVAGSLTSRAPATRAGFPSPGLLPGAEPFARAHVYSRGEMDGAAETTEEPSVWLVDGFNALHVAMLRGRDRQAWWRSEERERLVARVAGFEAGDAEVVVVFDGPRPLSSDGAAAGPRVVFASSADDWLLRQVREAPEPGRVAVVTADRQLADRARHRGAQVVAPRVFLERCGRPAGSI